MYAYFYQCVYLPVIWFQFVKASLHLNTPFCKHLLHLCMHHQVCLCVCVCLRQLCGFNLFKRVSIFACTMSCPKTYSSATKRCKCNDLPKSSPHRYGHKITKAPRLWQLGVIYISIIRKRKTIKKMLATDSLRMQYMPRFLSKFPEIL